MNDKSHQCEHIMESGLRCGSPRMNGNHFCYYHRRLHETFILPGHRLYEQPSLDNPHGIQLALTQLSAAIGKGIISSKEAGKMAYSISLAQNQLKRAAENAVPPGSIETEFTSGMRKALHIDDDKPKPDTDRANTESSAAQATVDATEDYSDHPLAEVEGLRPLNEIRPAGEAPRWIPITPKESEFLCNNLAADERKANFREKFCLRRLRLSLALPKNENPTTQQIMKAVMEVEQEEKNAIEVLNGLDPAGATDPKAQNHQAHQISRR